MSAALLRTHLGIAACESVLPSSAVVAMSTARDRHGAPMALHPEHSGSFRSHFNRQLRV